MHINKNALKRVLGYFAGGLLVVLGFAAAEENAYRTGVQDGLHFMPKLMNRYGDNPEELDNPEAVEEIKSMWRDHIKVFQKDEQE